MVHGAVGHKFRKEWNMESITLGEISAFFGFLAGLIGTMEYLHLRLKKWLKQALNDEFKGIKKDLTELKEENQHNGLQGCMNYLVLIIEKAKKEGTLSDTEKKRLYEVLDLYTNKYHKNSYIHNEVKELEEKNII